MFEKRKDRTIETTSIKEDEAIEKLSDKKACKTRHGFNTEIVTKVNNRKVKIEVVPLCFLEGEQEGCKLILKNASKKEKNQITEKLI